MSTARARQRHGNVAQSRTTAADRRSERVVSPFAARRPDLRAARHARSVCWVDAMASTSGTDGHELIEHELIKGEPTRSKKLRNPCHTDTAKRARLIAGRF